MRVKLEKKLKSFNSLYICIYEIYFIYMCKIILYLYIWDLSQIHVRWLIDLIFGNRYPSKKSTKHNDVINQEEKKYSKKQSSSLTERDDVHNNEEKKVDLCDTVSPAPKEETDFIKLNKERTSVANKLATQLNNGIPPTNYRKGVVPKYDH